MKLSHGPNTRKTLEELIDSSIELADVINPDFDRILDLVKHLNDIKSIAAPQFEEMRMREEHLKGARNKIAKTIHALKLMRTYVLNERDDDYVECLHELHQVLLYLDPEILSKYK